MQGVLIFLLTSSKASSTLLGTAQTVLKKSKSRPGHLGGILRS